MVVVLSRISSWDKVRIPAAARPAFIAILIHCRIPVLNLLRDIAYHATTLVAIENTAFLVKFFLS